MRRLAVIIALGIAALGPGCVTPSIPIPPPDPAQMTFMVTVDGGGVSTTSLQYPPTENYKGGIAYVYNRVQGVGVIQAVNANGSIGPTPPVRANLGDQIVVSVENDEQTVSTCILLRDGTQDPTSYCN